MTSLRPRGPGIAGIILPKVESAGEIRTIDWLMSQIETDGGMPERSVGLMGIIETARGLVGVDEIAAASARLSRLMFGAVDLAADMGIEMDDSGGATAQARFAIARASRAARLHAPLDTAFTDIADPDALRATSLRRALSATPARPASIRRKSPSSTRCSRRAPPSLPGRRRW